MTTKLSEVELDVAIDAEYAKMLREGLSVGPTNRTLAESSITTLMSTLDLGRPPMFTWFRSMPAVMAAYREVGGTEKPWFFYGRLLNYWYSSFRFAAKPEVGLLELDSNERMLLDAISSCIDSGAYWEPFAGTDESGPQVWAVDGPTQLRTDQDGQFHSEGKPAIAWADGSALYAWHGVFVPEAWIMAPDTVDPTLVLTHPNAELARCLGEILGWDAVLTRCTTKRIHTDSRPLVGGELLEAVVAGSRRRFVRVVCGTGRTFVLEVDANAETVVSAIAGTYGVSEAEYLQLQVRT